MKIKIVLMLFAAVISITACQKYYDTPNELYSIICKEMDIEAADINYAGFNVKDGSALLWYIAGDDIYNLKYVPVDCYITADDKLIFKHILKPIDRGENIAILQWQGGYSFFINNEKCKKLKVRCGADLKEFDISEYPFIYYSETMPNDYELLDENGESLER